VAAIVAVALLCGMLLCFVTATGSEAQSAAAGATTNIGDRFEDYVNNAKSAALEGIVPIKKVYRLDRANPIAPEPDQSLFGETDDPAVIEALLEDAAELIDGQEMQWHSGIKIVPGSKIQYYLDDTILVLTWKEAVNWAVYTFSEVKIADPSQLRRYLADNTFGSDIQYSTSDMASTVNAVVAINGDFYKFRSLGLVVYEGAVRRVAGSNIDSCGFDSQGNMHFAHMGEVTDQAAAEKFVADNDIVFSVAFGPIMVENGVNVCPPGEYVFGEITDIYARAAICQTDPLHYLLVTVNHEPAYSNCATVKDLAAELTKRGVDMAYTLDGGQTATIVMNDKVINSVEFGSQRNISDIIYFATALPD